MAFIAKRSVGQSGWNTEFKRLVTYMNAHITSLANIPTIVTPDGSDAATTQTLCNANKAKINAIITAFKGIGIATNIALITTPDGSSPATTQTLANVNKAKINAIIADLIANGLMSP